MTNANYTIDGETWFDQVPSHNPMTRKQELIAAAVNFDIFRCHSVVDTDPALAREMALAYDYVIALAHSLCDHPREFITARGQGVDLVILHICQDCERIMAAE